MNHADACVAGKFDFFSCHDEYLISVLIGCRVTRGKFEKGLLSKKASSWLSGKARAEFRSDVYAFVHKQEIRGATKSGGQM
jgi:hypothetical protein